MSTENQVEKSLLPHHEQQALCTTRLPYRQGRKLTAVKVYTINNESAHLLVFGVPSLNIRQETKNLFLKFGKLLQFNLTSNYPNEMFTETYHALYDRIQAARVAKKMLDGKNFYGGFLHVCYAPELESISELKSKLMQRRKDVLFRLKKHENMVQLDSKNPELINENVQLEMNDSFKVHKEIQNEATDSPTYGEKLDMGQVNTIYCGNQKKKRKKQDAVIKKKIKPNVTQNIEIVDCTNVDRETITNLYEREINLNETLNCANFGNEIIRQIPEKPLNKIKFYVSDNKDKS